jgi:hypothetical protein
VAVWLLRTQRSETKEPALQVDRIPRKSLVEALNPIGYNLIAPQNKEFPDGFFHSVGRQGQILPSDG